MVGGQRFDSEGDFGKVLEVGGDCLLLPQQRESCCLYIYIYIYIYI